VYFVQIRPVFNRLVSGASFAEKDIDTANAG
jgi:hypothetical protein